MTCEELHLYFENQSRGEAVLPDPGMADHISGCEVCSRFVQEQSELRKGLRLIRDSVTAVPESLDAAVLASYRRRSAGRSGPSPVLTLSPVVLRWSAVAAAVLVGVVLLWFHAHRTVTTAAAPTVGQPTAELPRIEVPANTRAAGHGTNSGKGGVQASTRKHPSRPMERPAAAPVRASNSIPNGFRSLMYCDELSCTGDMDVIRVQLPSAVVARPVSGFAPTSGAVNAVVLVGPDGIARGIRIED